MVESIILFIIDALYLIFSPYISAFLCAYFCWVPPFIFDTIFPLLILLDLLQRIGDFKKS